MNVPFPKSRRRGRADDPFDILDCALRSRYLSPGELPAAPIWHRLPGELRSALAEALAVGEPLGVVLRLVWQVRARLLGKPEPDYTCERTRVTAALKLGLLYLAHREGRMAASELLTRAFRVADSYVCGVDPRPFLRLRSEAAAGGAAEARVAELFAPYAGLAARCVEQWGLRPGELPPQGKRG